MTKTEKELVKRAVLWMLAFWVASVVALAAGAGLLHARREEARLQSLVHTRDQYCRRVKMRIENDAQDLAAGTPQRQRDVAQDFGELDSGHSYNEIEMCVAGPIPDWDKHWGCRWSHDFKCLADIATAVARAIVVDE